MRYRAARVAAALPSLLAVPVLLAVPILLALSILLTVAGATLTLPGRAIAAEAGFDVKITELPATFGAGAESRSLTVVVSSDRTRCIKVRWSLLLQVDGPDVDEVKVTRVEDDGDFAVQRQDGDNTARITDDAVDPGQLCRNSTVTARYRISFGKNADTGSVTFQPQAFTATGTLLQETSGRSPVVGQQPAANKSPSPSPSSPSPSPTATQDESEETGNAAADQTSTPEPDDIAAVPASSEGGPPSLLGPGLIVGALLVFAGVALLLRLRLRQRAAAARLAEPPTGFYPTH